ncbi:hypothetical protein DTO021D3_4879 [Paecilomyces variotii]|nr:hypothetical protein DTO212C5_8140 [Paecilomyces variotii]KAJ9278145.1 hypothetical protein DTO021D3_4879 [Paecilomyces variotii]KAJ9345509.1 hypothetical protein DTO027B6_2040 [Paecilomyces variotii]
MIPGGSYIGSPGHVIASAKGRPAGTTGGGSNNSSDHLSEPPIIADQVHLREYMFSNLPNIPVYNLPD